MILNNFIYKIIEKDLKNKKYKNIKTRFAPEPNGLLHLGHAKSIYLNYEIANYFNGTCNLRFDDTNPTVEKFDYVNYIIKDIKWLGYNCCSRLFYTSNYFIELYKYAIKLIKKRLAYVDELSPSKIKIFKGSIYNLGINSPYRYRSIKENLLAFDKMKNGEFKEEQACLRAKINMYSKIYILRDPIIYRIKYVKHHNTNNQWCIYPMYDFAHCISDYLEGITHSLCTMEFEQNRILYNWILNNINIKFIPKQYEFSRLNLTYNIMAKRKILNLINHKIINNWDDPRIITLSGLRRRGYTSKCIKLFCKQIGISRQENRIPYSKLENIARKIYNKKVYRIMAVLNPIKIIFINLKANFYLNIKVLNIPNNPLSGERNIYFSNPIYISKNDFKKKIINYKKILLTQFIKLRYIPIIIKINKIIKYNNGKINYLICNAYWILEKKYNKFPIIQWVSYKKSLPIKCFLYSNLFNSKNPENNYLQNINKNSLTIVNGRIENSILNTILINNIYQFERLGYFILVKKKIDKKFFLIFNLITKLNKNYYL